MSDTTQSDTTTADRSYHSVCISDMEFWALTTDERETTFAELRAEAPVSWQPPVRGALMQPENDGYWAVTTNELIAEVSKNPEIFCSGQGVQFEEIPEDFLEAAMSFLGMDGQRHLQYRRLVNAAFTPRQVRRIEEQIAARAVSLVDELIEAGSGDFVPQLAARMPMDTIYDMLGLPVELRTEAAHLADLMVGWNDPDLAAGRSPADVVAEGLVGLVTMALEFTAETRANPRDDIWTELCRAEVDGEMLSDEDIASFFVLLSVAGNDTTRNTITLGAKALTEHPDQRGWLLADYDARIDTAVEEIVRWVTPVMTFRRTATRDTELGGQQIREGDWVAMFYTSGNRDPQAFDDPQRFDLARKPNGHVGFGGGGPHYCLGHFLAKMQLRHIFHQLLTRVPDLELGAPQHVVGNFVYAVSSMPFRVRPALPS